MNEDQLLPTLKNKVHFTFWETTVLLTWILVKLTLLASMMNKGATEFIYAGF
tara:strand:- start:77 stop:232 length:156 start_codon:yes stop_codon:yes gene_type:complete